MLWLEPLVEVEGADGTRHGFTNVGTGRLRILCLHASDRIIQEWRDAPGELDIPTGVR